MDKTQKLLIDTYFRKRAIALTVDAGGEYRGYESFYVLDHNMDTSAYGNDEIWSIIYSNPQYIDKFDLNKLTPYQIESIVKVHPELLPKFNQDKLIPIDIMGILYHHPELINQFDFSKYTIKDFINLQHDRPTMYDAIKRKMEFKHW